MVAETSISSILSDVVHKPGVSAQNGEIDLQTLQQVWKGICAVLESTLLQRKGVMIPNFGHFTFRKQEMDEGTWGKKVTMIPTFYLHPTFCSQFGLSPSKPSVNHKPAGGGPAPTVLLSTVALSLNTKLSRDLISNVMKDVFRRIGEVAASGGALCLDFGVCRINFTNLKYSISWSSNFLGHITASDNAKNHPALKTNVKTKATLAGGAFKPASQAAHDAAALEEVRTELAAQFKKPNNPAGGRGGDSIGQSKSRRISKKAPTNMFSNNNNVNKPPLAAPSQHFDTPAAPPSIDYSPSYPLKDRPHAPKPGKTISQPDRADSEDLNSVLTPTDCQSLQSTIIEVQPQGQYGQGSGRAAVQQRKRRMQEYQHSVSTASVASSVGGSSGTRSAPSTPQHHMKSYGRRESTPPPNTWNNVNSASPSRLKSAPATSAPFATVPNPSGVRGSAPQTPESPPNPSNLTSNDSSGLQGFSGPLAAHMMGHQTAQNAAGSAFPGQQHMYQSAPAVDTPSSLSSAHERSSNGSSVRGKQRPPSRTSSKSSRSGGQYYNAPAPAHNKYSYEDTVDTHNNNGMNSSEASPSRSAMSMFVDDPNLPYHVRRRRIKNYNRMVRRAGMSDTWVQQIAEQKAQSDRNRVDDLQRARQFLNWTAKENGKETEKERNKKVAAFKIGKENEMMAQEKARQHFENPHIQPMGYLFSHHEELHALPPDLGFLKSQIETKRAIEETEKYREQERDRMLGERQAQEFRDQIEAEIRRKKETQERVAAAYEEQLNTTKTFSVLPGRYNDAEGPEGSGNFFFGNKSATPMELAQEERREKQERRVKLRDMIRKNMEEDMRLKETQKHERRKQEMEDRTKVEYLRAQATQQEYEERQKKRQQKAEMKKAWDMQCEEKQWNSKTDRSQDVHFQETVHFQNHSSDEDI